tara:strand:+ start:13066 stop:14472 length:1407 start_codon:yes stop_codon:yes gene_type:complete
MEVPVDRAVNEFQHYFGKIPKAIRDHNDPYQHETFNLPEAYLGKNRFLMQTFDYLITKDGREFLTKYILPFEHTENLNVAWEVFHFDKTIADIEPEQGMPRYVTQSHDQYSDTLTRRGLAFIIEHGFYTTPLGKQHYLMNIRQIVDAVADTCAYQVIRALLDAEEYYTTDGTHDSSDKKIYIRNTMRRFGIVQRGEHGMHILDSDLKDLMNREGVKPDAYIFPARMSSYIRMRDPYMTEHNRGGIGAQALVADPEPSALSFRGTKVFECRYFETDYIEEPFDPLEETFSFNEYYHVKEGHNLHVFCMESDSWHQVKTYPDQRKYAKRIDGSAEVKRKTLIDTKLTSWVQRVDAAQDLIDEASGANPHGWYHGDGLGGLGFIGEHGVGDFGDALGDEERRLIYTPEIHETLNFRRFPKGGADYDSVASLFASHSVAAQLAVTKDLQMLGAEDVVRPKFLTTLFEAHSAE